MLEAKAVAGGGAARRVNDLGRQWSDLSKEVVVVDLSGWPGLVVVRVGEVFVVRLPHHLHAWTTAQAVNGASGRQRAGEEGWHFAAYLFVHTEHSRKAGAFSVARLKMDLPFHNRLAYNHVHRRSASPHPAVPSAGSRRARAGAVEGSKPRRGASETAAADASATRSTRNHPTGCGRGPTDLQPHPPWIIPAVAVRPWRGPTGGPRRRAGRHDEAPSTAPGHRPEHVLN